MLVTEKDKYEAHHTHFQQSKPEVKAGKEGAFKASVEWLQKYL